MMGNKVKTQLSKLKPGTTYYPYEGMAFRHFFIGPSSRGGFDYVYCLEDGSRGGEAHTFEDLVVWINGEVKDK